MADQASVRFHLETGGTDLKLARFAIDSAAMRDSWSSLPGDLRFAQGELQKLTQTQIRAGHLRAQDREQVRLYQDHVRRHYEGLAQVMGQLRREAGASPAAGAYSSIMADGGRAAVLAAARKDPELRNVVAMHDRMGSIGKQMEAIDQARGVFDKWELKGSGTWRQDLAHWGKGATWGRDSNGDPVGPGEWAKRKASGALQSTRRNVARVSSIFTAFVGLNTLIRGMDAFEKKAMIIQELGSKLGPVMVGVGDAFSYVDEVISGKSDGAGGRATGGIRKKYGYTLAELTGGLRTLAHYQGNLDYADPAARMARALGMDPSSTMSTFARAGQYGAVNADLLERTLYGTGMRSRPDLALNWFGAGMAQLGQGFLRVPTEQVSGYMGHVTDAMGPAYQNERGQQLMQRLIGGVRSPQGGMIEAARLHAVRGLGRVDLGGGYIADTSTYRGMRAVLESGSSQAYEALFKEAVKLAGKGSLGRETFQALTGRTLNIMESDMMFEAMQRGQTPTAAVARIKQSPNLDQSLAAATRPDSPAWQIQQTRTAMEQDVYERVGESLKPIAIDFQKAALMLADRMSVAADGMELAGAMIAGSLEALEFLGPTGAANPATKGVFFTSQLFSSNNIADLILKGGIGALAALLGGQMPKSP